MNVSIYTDYFRQLAIHHADIQHNPAGESGDAPVGSMHFTFWSADVTRVLAGESLMYLRSKVSFPALLLEFYEVNASAEIEYDVRTEYSGAFSVAVSALPENFVSEIAALQKAENIMTDLIQQIWDDHYGQGKDRCTSPFEYFNLNLNIVPFGPILEQQFGYRCEFTFKFIKDKKFSQPPAAGRFI